MNDYVARTPELREMPLSIGLAGPPGGGKTMSALRLARGMQRVRPGPIVFIDTENRRAVRYHRGEHNPHGFEFLHVDLKPPFQPERIRDAIRAQLALNPAAIIVDSLSDEHEGEGGYLDMHDEDVPKSGGNEWAAWKRPSGQRKKLTSAWQQITVPLIFTFRAREKTKQVGKRITKLGYQPVAPAEILYALDLACLLPLGAHGAATWTSTTESENFNLKTVEFLQRLLRNGEVLNEDLGEEFARWALGTAAPPRPDEKRVRTLDEMVDGYVAAINQAGLVNGLDDTENGLSALMEVVGSDGANKLRERLAEHAGDRREVLVGRMDDAARRRHAQLTRAPVAEEPASGEDGAGIKDDSPGEGGEA